MPGELKVGFVHARDWHPQEGGVPRYGRVLAQAASRKAGVIVQECVLEFSGDLRRDLEATRECGRALSGCNVIHVQFSRYIWGLGDRGRRLLDVLQRSVRAAVVVTFHDVQPEIYPASGRCCLLAECYRSVRTLGFGRSYACWRAIRLVASGYLADRRTLRWLLKRAALLVVSTDEEKERLRFFPGAEAIEVIPHFIERRNPVRTREEARQALGLEQFCVVVLLGYFSPGKGHRVAMEALKLLPENYRLIFAGAMTRQNEHSIASPNPVAPEWANESRLKITGFLSEWDLESYMLAADVAICPFTALSASGSLATWLSLAFTPIIASDFPQVRFYNKLAPGAIALVPAGDADALAQAIQDCSSERLPEARLKLRELFSVERTVDEYLRMYRKAQVRSRQGAALPLEAVSGLS